MEKTIVLLHGFGEDHRIFEKQVKVLSENLEPYSSNIEMYLNFKISAKDGEIEKITDFIKIVRAEALKKGLKIN